jgi:beta-galactosidase beta subunit
MGLNQGNGRDHAWAAEVVLHQLVSGRDFISGNAKQKESRQAIYDTVTDVSFVSNLEKTLVVLAPIDAALTLYQK